MLSAPALPLRVRCANALMRAARTVGFQREALDAQRLLQQACDGTGLDDFGSDHFLAGYRVLLDSLAAEAELSPLGVIIARQEILMALGNRLQLIDYHRRYSEIGEADIREPIFIIGQGRSGTTIMHELLALDPQLRVPLTWEVDHPFPPPESATYDSDPRIALTQRTLE
ncbi:MAG: sulfotransferase, partial [Halioglobus sp.]|nr:sulfotransferase [Halioglobus sp.]